MLKTRHVHALIPGREEIYLNQNWKLPPRWLAFIELVAATQAYGRMLSPTFLLGGVLREIFPALQPASLSPGRSRGPVLT